MMKMKIKQGLADVCGVWATEMRNTFRDEGVLIFFILVPLFYPLLYSWIYTNEVVREVPVAVVDMSHSDMSRSFIRQFDASPDVSVALYCNNLDVPHRLPKPRGAHGAKPCERVLRHELHALL